MIGRRLSHFEIVGRIGAGGMGIVYQAVDLRLQRSVALKVLPPEASAQPDLRERLFREARAASALNHPGIVTVFEVDSADGVDFIAMEYVEGRSLDRLIPAGGLEPRVAVGYAIQIADALASAHGAGIVHRDLKPRNLLVTPEGRLKILDFGIAKRAGPVQDDSGGLMPTQSIAAETLEGVVVGTPQYMSPEQAQGLKVDARSDIFSLGAVLHEMLTGQPPFTGDDLAQVVNAILRSAPPPLRSRRRDVPPALERVVARMLRKAPCRGGPPTGGRFTSTAKRRRPCAGFLWTADRRARSSTAGTWDRQTGGHLDPDGRRIVYSLVEKGRPVETRVRDLATGRETPLVRALWGPRFAPDGRSVVGNMRRIYVYRPGRPWDDPSRRSREVWVMGASGEGAHGVATLEPEHALSAAFNLSVREEVAWVQFRRGKEELWAAEWPAR